MTNHLQVRATQHEDGREELQAQVRASLMAPHDAHPAAHPARRRRMVGEPISYAANLDELQALMRDGRPAGRRFLATSRSGER